MVGPNKTQQCYLSQLEVNQMKDKSKESKSKENKGQRITTLGELGATLPIGISNSTGILQKELSVRPWRFKEERELGQLRAENKNTNVGRYVGMLLSIMCKRFGNNEIETMEFDKRRLTISGTYMPDVLYAYVYLRKVAMGTNLPLDPRCPRCGNDFVFNADLDSLEVKVVDRLEDTYWNYDLQTPIIIRKKEIRKLSFGPLKWSTLERLGDKGISQLNTGAAKLGMIHGSMRSISELERVPIVEEELDGMVKYDIEMLSHLIDKNSVGPDMSIKGRCPKQQCNHEFQIPINWETESFFGISSR